MMLLRCRFCRKGLTQFRKPAFRCPLCGSSQWVECTRLTLTDRCRLWFHTGLPPWTKLELLPV